MSVSAAFNHPNVGFLLGGDVAVQRLYIFVKCVGICWVETRLIASLHNLFGFWSLSAAETNVGFLLGGDVAVQRLYIFVKCVVVCWVQTQLIASVRIIHGR